MTFSCDFINGYGEKWVNDFSCKLTPIFDNGFLLKLTILHCSRKNNVGVFIFYIGEIKVYKS